MWVGGPFVCSPTFQAEWRVGDDKVELLEFSFVGDEEGLVEGVFSSDLGIFHVVDEQVHSADCSGGGVDFLAVEAHASDFAASRVFQQADVRSDE